MPLLQGVGGLESIRLTSRKPFLDQATKRCYALQAKSDRLDSTAESPTFHQRMLATCPSRIIHGADRSHYWLFLPTPYLSNRSLSPLSSKPSSSGKVCLEMLKLLLLCANIPFLVKADYLSSFQSQAISLNLLSNQVVTSSLQESSHH